MQTNGEANDNLHAALLLLFLLLHSPALQLASLQARGPAGQASFTHRLLLLMFFKRKQTDTEQVKDRLLDSSKRCRTRLREKHSTLPLCNDDYERDLPEAWQTSAG